MFTDTASFASLYAHNSLTLLRTACRFLAHGQGLQVLYLGLKAVMLAAHLGEVFK